MVQVVHDIIRIVHYHVILMVRDLKVDAYVFLRKTMPTQDCQSFIDQLEV